MAKLFDRVGQATATTGTGTVTLGSVITDATNGDFATFTDMGGVATDVVNYLIVDGNNWELGTGTLGGTGPGFTLTRTVSKSKISGTVGTTALTLSGTAVVYSAPSNVVNSEFWLSLSYHYGLFGATNYSRLKIVHVNSTGATISTEKGGTGVAGDLILQPGSGVLTVQAPSSGIITNFVLQATAANATSSSNASQMLLSARNSGGTQIAFLRADGLVSGTALSTSDDATACMDQLNSPNGLKVKSSAVVGFSSTGNWWGAIDAALMRNAAGVVEINSGTAGTLRDLIARNVRTNATTVASLTAAATAGAGARSFVTDATATTFLSTVAGGGSNKVPVVSDGTNWLIG